MINFRFNQFEESIYKLLIRFMLKTAIPARKKSFITCSGKIDGLGDQTLAIFSTQLYAEIFGLTYVHTKLREVEHNYDGDPCYEQKIEELFSYSLEEAKIEDEGISHLQIVDLQKVGDMIKYLLFTHFFKPKAIILFKTEQCYFYINAIQNKYHLISDKLKRKFYATPKPYPLHKKKGALTIAVHARRGDVPMHRYTFDAEIKERLERLISTLKQFDIPFDICIYSQGKKEDFEDLSQLATLHLDTNVFEVFFNLVKADILLASKSSFCYSAALLSEGIVIYERFWHTPCRHWFVYKEGLFSQENVQKAIETAFSMPQGKLMRGYRPDGDNIRNDINSNFGSHSQGRIEHNITSFTTKNYGKT